MSQTILEPVINYNTDYRKWHRTTPAYSHTFMGSLHADMISTCVCTTISIHYICVAGKVEMTWTKLVAYGNLRPLSLGEQWFSRISAKNKKTGRDNLFAFQDILLVIGVCLLCKCVQLVDLANWIPVWFSSWGMGFVPAVLGVIKMTLHLSILTWGRCGSLSTYL